MKIRARKKRKKITLSLKLLYIFIITLVIIVSFSYARYKTTYTGGIEVNTAKWAFKVNNQNQTFVIDLIDTIDTTSPLINRYAYNESVIAPTARGNFSLDIDCTECEVSVDYDIYITPHEGTAFPKDIYIYSPTIYTNKTRLLNKHATKTITLQEIRQNPIVTIDFEWLWQAYKFNTESTFEGQPLLLDIVIEGKQHIE